MKITSIPHSRKVSTKFPSKEYEYAKTTIEQPSCDGDIVKREVGMIFIWACLIHLALDK